MERVTPAVQSSREDSQFLDSMSFVDAMEEAQARGDVETVELNLPTLERLLTDMAGRKQELDALEQRARAVQQHHSVKVDQRPSGGTYVSRSTLEIPPGAQRKPGLWKPGGNVGE